MSKHGVWLDDDTLAEERGSTMIRLSCCFKAHSQPAIFNSTSPNSGLPAKRQVEGQSITIGLVCLWALEPQRGDVRIVIKGFKQSNFTAISVPQRLDVAI